MDAQPHHTIKAKFDGKVFVPEGDVQLPIGASVTIDLSNGARSLEDRKKAFLNLIGSISDPTFVEPEDLPEREVPKL